MCSHLRCSETSFRKRQVDEKIIHHFSHCYRMEIKMWLLFMLFVINFHVRVEATIASHDHKTEMSNFVNRYIDAVKNSSVQDEALKENAERSITAAFHRFKEHLGKNDQYHELQTERIKIEIVTSALKVKASFTKPPLPNIHSNEVLFGFELWSHIRDYARNDLEQQRQFLAEKVLPLIINDANHLSPSETNFRLKQVERYVIPEFDAFDEKPFDKRYFGGKSTIDLIEHYNSLSWTKYTHTLDHFENVSQLHSI